MFVLSACLLLAASACTSAPPSPPTPPPPTAPPAPRPTPSPAPASPAAATAIPIADPAVHVFLWGHPDTTDRDLGLAQAAGFTWIKQRFEWRYIEGKGKGQFEWGEPDRILRAVEPHHLRVIARLDNQPQWAASKVPYPANGPPDNLQDWTDFVSALAARYKGRIAAYEVWNEPNLAREWGEEQPDPGAYTRLLEASYAAIKAADPQALVVSAGMSPTTDSGPKATRDLDFLRGMYAAGARGSFDVLGVHAPGYKAEPCADPGQVAADPALTNNDQSLPAESRRVYAFRHVEDVRQLMVEQGDADKQVGVLEMGWTTDQRPGSPYRWHAVSRDEQASNLVQAFQCARQRWSPWIGFLTVIYIPDPEWTPQQEQFWWSITNPDGTPRPAYTALKGLLAQA